MLKRVYAWTGTEDLETLTAHEIGYSIVTGGTKIKQMQLSFR